MKQEVVADFLNIRQATYSRYESGKRRAPYEVLEKLAEGYETSVDYILGITNEKTAYNPVNRHVPKLL